MGRQSVFEKPARTPRRRYHRRIVNWRLWDRHNKRFYVSAWGISEWATQEAAQRHKVNITGGKRNHAANWFRIRIVPVAILADGTSPMRDEIQKHWEGIHETCNTKPVNRKAE